MNAAAQKLTVGGLVAAQGVDAISSGGFVEKACLAWGSPPPSWVEELARCADAHGLAGAEKRIGYSRSTISTVLANKYPGDLSRVEQKVRGALMFLTVECPVLGRIGRDRCLNEQNAPFRATSAHRTKLYRACRGGCPHSKHTKGQSDE